jgi:predicted small integral membrane protein
VAVLGLSLGVLLWLGGFMAIGGEWFGMWMSSQWNGLQSASRFVVVLLLALVYLGQRDDELDR